MIILDKETLRIEKELPFPKEISEGWGVTSS